MTEPNMAGPGKFNWRIFSYLTVGVFGALIGGLAVRIAIETPASPPKPPGPINSPVPPTGHPVDVEAERQRAWQRIQPRLGEADAESSKLMRKLVRRIESFFDERKAGTRDFAEAVLGWRSKWELIKSREGHRKFIEDRISEYIFTKQDLEAMLKQAADEYAQGLKAVENELLVNVQADLQDFSADALPEFANERVLKAQFDKIVAQVTPDVARDLEVNVGQEITSFAAGEIIAVVVTKVLTSAATRMSVSAAIIGTGATTAWATVGAGIVIAIVADYLLDLIIDWIHDPVGDISEFEFRVFRRLVPRCFLGFV